MERAAVGVLQPKGRHPMPGHGTPFRIGTLGPDIRGCRCPTHAMALPEPGCPSLPISVPSIDSPFRIMSRKLFVTTALPYANGTFHIGHIMEYTQADIWVRFQRMQGQQVHFVCADDAHGAPIMIAAEKAGQTPQEFVAGIAAGGRATSTVSTSVSTTGTALMHLRTTSSPRTSTAACAAKA